MIRCPVCDFAGLDIPPYEFCPPAPGVHLEPPYYRQLGRPSYDVCPSRGFEFGFEDDPGGDLKGDSFESWRQKWEAEGRPWFSGISTAADYVDQERLQEVPE